jgi:hypothetical protein
MNAHEVESLDQDLAWRPSTGECEHTPCYCEENAHKLCQNIKKRSPAANLHVVFISNTERKVRFSHAHQITVSPVHRSSGL